MSTKEVSYYSNVIFDLDENEEMQLILAQSKIDKKTADNLEGAMKLVYKNGIAKEVICIEEGEYEEPFEVRFQTEPIKFVDYPENIYNSIIIDPMGKHVIGGEPPSYFEPPVTKSKAPFMYIGNLDCNLEESLKWTGFSIFHLVCPILAEIEVIYLDYTNPNKPEVINYKEVNSFETPFEGLNYGDNFFLKATNVSFKKQKMDYIYESKIMGNIGAPSWIQSEIIPRCPKSLKPMKFLVSLETSRFGEINSSNVNINDEPIATSINLFNSWGCGTLFVFYLPESKTAAYFIQNT